MTTPVSVCDYVDLELADPPTPPQQSPPPLSDFIQTSALQILDRISKVGDGYWPVTLDQWIKCCEHYEICVRSLKRGVTFTALLVGTRGGAWWIFYNSMASPQKQVRYIAHELAEYLMQEGSWLNQPPQEYDGICEYHIRHLIAKAVEDIVAQTT